MEEAKHLLTALLKKKIDFIGTIDEMREKLDVDLRIGALYSFNCFWRAGVKVMCGPVLGTLIERLLDSNNKVLGYKMRINTTNTSADAPSIMSENLVISPAYLNGRVS